MEMFMPHGMCFMWNKLLLTLHVGSNLLVGLSYYIISFCLYFILKRRTDLPMRNVFKVYILFILFCGTGHFFDILTIWKPYYYAAGYLKAAIALISVTATVMMLKSMKDILNLPNINLLREKIKNENFEILNALQTAVLVSDDNFKITYTNSRVSEIFGYEVEELVGQDINILIPERFQNKHNVIRSNFLQNPYRTEMGQNRKLLGKTKSGEEKELDISIVPQKQEDQWSFVLGIYDLTEQTSLQKKMEETKQLLEISTQEIPALLSYVGADKRYRYVNAAYERYWGVPRKKIIGEKIQNVLGAKTWEIIEEHVAKVLQGEKVQFKIKTLSHKGDQVVLDAYYVPDFDLEMKVQGFTVLGFDITEIDNAKRQLHLKNRNLEEYAYLVSHDLRAPMRHISNFSELLKEEIEKESFDREVVNQYMDLITNNSKRMQSMISGMLDLSKYANSSLEKTATPMLKYLESSLQPIYSKEDLNLEFTGNPELRAFVDQRIFYQIFQNLLSNAVKYRGAESPKAQIDVSKEKRTMYIRYKDNSKGFDKELFAKAKKAFWKGDTNTEGPGLGLAIVELIVSSHGGEIECLNNEGVEFLIKLEKQ